MRRRLMLALAILGAPLAAHAQTAKGPTITVGVNSSVETPPDRATLSLNVRGQGNTPDAATTALAAKLKAIVAGLRSIDPTIEVRTGSVAISEAHAGDCDSEYDSTADPLVRAADALADKAAGKTAPKSGTAVDPCMVIGNVARSETNIVMSSVKDAGTAVGLAGRLGANEAKVESFDLRDDAAARARAIAAAAAKARAQAEAIAAASGMKLGPIVSVTDGSDNRRGVTVVLDSLQTIAGNDIVISAPVRVDIAPAPVETSAQLIVTYALEK